MDEMTQKLMNTTDAQVWAQEFIRTWGHRLDEVDTDLMLTWFANAMGVQQSATESAYRKAAEEHNQPVPMHRDTLSAILVDIAKGFESGDTLEGSIEFYVPEFPCPDDTDGDGLCGNEGCPRCDGDHWMVRASYRIGNTMGQGGVRLIGTVNERSRTISGVPVTDELLDEQEADRA